ncbi:MAG: alpha/beta hydrolase [Microcystaceae cyanobacterium]
MSLFSRFPLKKFSCRLPLNALLVFTLGTIAPITFPLSSQAAEEIRFVYDSLLVSIPVESLEAFAREDRVSRQLRNFFVLTRSSEEDREAFRQALIKPIEVDPLLLSRSLNTEEGKRMLNYFGKVINVQGGRNGEYIIRGAIVSAALDEEEGLTVLNVLKKFSTNVEINLAKSLDLARQVEKIVLATYAFVEQVEVLADKEVANSEPIDFSQLPDIRQPGPLGFQQQRWNLFDQKRNRNLYVEVYQPQQFKAGKTPVVIISHGLASNPESFSRRAEHLASYGYVVVMPQHPGSDTLRAEMFIEGFSFQTFDRNEFIDRPLDISYILDELERRNQGQFQGRLDLENVGVFGHSFGGYGVLAVAGATMDFENLERVCDIELGLLNTALLLQCRALQLERKDYNFRDERVTAVFALNPVNSGIFGPVGLAQIKIPTFISAGSYDPATPFVFEQSVSYPRLVNTKNKYLQLQEGQAHVDFSQLDGGITDLIETTEVINLPSPLLLDAYTNSMMLAFFQTYIVGDNNYKVYLSSAYADYISTDEDFKSHLITAASAEALYQFIEDYANKNFPNLQREDL